MSETRKLAAILCSDVVGYSRLAAADEDRILARLRALRSDLIDPTIAVHHGRIVKRTGDGSIVEFRSVVDAVRCAIEVQNAMVERNAGVPEDRRIVFRIGIHLGDIVEESDGDLMGDGVNIAARLEGVAAPGTICLSEDAYRQVKGRLDLAVTDLGLTQLKNIAEPIRAYSLQVGVPAQARPEPTKPAAPNKRPTPALLFSGIAALLIVIAAGAWHFLAANRPMALATNAPAPVASNSAALIVPLRLSLVVLPFANLSNDPGQDYFADGITENLTTELSRIRNSFVIARETAFTFKGKGADAKEIGKQLGVRYVLEGSVERNQNRVRVNAQLIDAESGAHLWAERFEEDIADLFNLEDQVVARLANTLSIELVKAEAAKSARSKNPDAIDLDMRGQALVLKFSPQSTNEKELDHAAQALFEQALAIDPNDVDALAGAAYTYYLDYLYEWKPADTDYETKLLAQLDRAIALDPENLRAYTTKSQYLSNSRRPNESLSAADSGLAVNPNYAPLYRARANAENGLGRFEQAKSDVQQAIRLSPHDPRIGTYLTTLAAAEIGLGHFDAAIDAYRRAIEAGFRSHVPYMGLAAARALDGKMDEAKSALAEARRINPNLTVKWAIARNPNVPSLFEGLRKAGLPEE
jgi:adenylate cyclase